MREICRWGDYLNRSILIADENGKLYLESHEQGCDEPLLAMISKHEAAQRIAAEKYEFEQEELVYLQAYAILELILPLLGNKFMR